MFWGAEVTVAQLVVWVGIGVSLWFCGMSVYSVWAFLGRRRPAAEAPEEWLPPATVMKPLNGLDPGLYANLVSFCEQDYPEFQIVFGVADPQDPAAGWVRRLQREHPRVDIDLVIDGRIHGANYKISNLVNMYARAKHGVIVIADSDIRVGRDYLRRVAGPLRDPRVGLVTCLYRAVNAGGFSSLIDALCVNTDFLPQVMVARQLEKAKYAFGATMAVRRADLEAVGGLNGLVDLLADDYHLGNRIAAQGLDIHLSDCIVETVVDVGSWRQLRRHQMRWARTNRSSRPVSFFFTILTHGPTWAVANVLLNGLGGTALAISGFMLAARALTAAHLSWRHLGTNLRWLDLVVMLGKDLLVSGVWMASFLGSTVWWSGRRFRVLRSGELELVAPALDGSAAEVAMKQAS